MPTRATLTAATLGVMFCAAAAIAAPPSEHPGLEFFERRIRPVLIEHCYRCHSQQAEKLKANLYLDSRDGVRQGGDAGASIVVGDADASLLIRTLEYEDADLQMPPDGKLPRHVIADFRRWINMGAPDPRVDEGRAGKRPGIDIEKGRQLWAFQPVADPAPPSVRDTSWPRSEIDRFVLAKLEAAGLRPVADADRHTLLRRVTYDLTGRPPTPAEIDAFINDPASDDAALVKVVDRLLASPEFGERWGRHWLDVARYADTMGTARFMALNNAWRYRDYVIESFNADRPYDRFLREQIAGDLLPAETDAERARQIIATGFLAIDVYPSIANDPVQHRWDTIDAQLDKVGRVTMGMTLGCARCHDHKFDPIPQRDYYAMAGIFYSTQTHTGHIGTTVFMDWVRTPLPESETQAAERIATRKAWESERAALKQHKEELENRRDTLRERIASQSDGEAKAAAEAELRRVMDELAMIPDRLKHMSETMLFDGPPEAIAVRDRDEASDAPMTVRGNAHQLGETVPRGLMQVASTGPAPSFSATASGRLELADWITSPEHPLTARIAVNRIWHHLFGRGIVSSVDNFGANGSTPTHPQLLDHLATRFIDDGWSFKKTIRRITLSRVYRLGNDPDTRAIRTDPDNELLWRARRRRLEGEALRDTVLIASGQLDRTMGGKTMPLPTKQINERADDRKRELNGNDAEPSVFVQRRRSVYLPVYRRALSDAMGMMKAFDFPDPGMITGDRDETIVPSQALFLLNSPFMREQSRLAAQRLIDEAPDNAAERVGAFYLRTLGRPATKQEVDDGLAFVDRIAATLAQHGRDEAAAQLIAWSRFCQSLLASNEFLFRD